MLSLGDFSTDDFDFKDWFLFIFATVLLQIVMLNLLIAILSDTYDKVMDASEETDSMALNDLILEAEYLRFSQRELNNKSYLHWVEVKNEGNKVWGGKNKRLTSAMD